MTTNQIAYFQVVESRRHNQAMENENFRHNVQTERISELSANLGFAGTVYSADQHFNATKYSADLNSATQIQTSLISAETARYVADKNFQASIYGADKRYDAAVYTAKKNAASQRYAVAIQSQDNRYSTVMNYNIQNRANQIKQGYLDLEREYQPHRITNTTFDSAAKFFKGFNDAADAVSSIFNVAGTIAALF